MVRMRLLRVSVLALLGMGIGLLPAHAQYPGIDRDKVPVANAPQPAAPPSLDDMTMEDSLMGEEAPNTAPSPLTPQSTLSAVPPRTANGTAPANSDLPPDLEPGTYVLRSPNAPPLIFVPATPENLSKSYIKLSGVDLNDEALVDDFASVNLCEMFIQYHDDEFAWRDARKAIRRHIERNMEKYPEYMAFDSKVSFDKYDFGIQAFRLAEGSKFSRTGKFGIGTRLETACMGRGGLTRIPTKYNIRLSNPITLDAIPMKEERAYRFLNDLKAEKNKGRTVYITFFIRINDFSANNALGSATTTGEPLKNEVVTVADARATLVTLRFYEDEERTRLLYEYQPETTNPFEE